MKKILFVVTIILLLCPDVSLSAYIIYLKNGGQIEADSYWKEGNQIRYRIKEGEVGIGIDEVLEIKAVSKESVEKEKKEEIQKTPSPSAEYPVDTAGKEALRQKIGAKKAELSFTIQMISETESKLDFIGAKEKELDEITTEIGRAKYAELIRRKRELEAKKEQLSKEVEDLLKNKDALMNNLKELKDRKNTLENELSDLEYQERYGTAPPVPAGQ